MRTKLIIAVVLSLGIYFAPRCEGQSSPKHPENATANQGRTSSPAPQEAQRNAKPEKSTNSQSLDRNETSQWALVIVGIITIVVVGWQAWESRRAVDISQKTMVAQFRPRLKIRNIRLDDADRPADVIVTLVNIGGTTARIVGGTVGVQSTNSWEIGKSEWIAKGTILCDKIVHAGEECEFPEIALGETLGWAVASKAASESHYSTAIVCSGVVSYRDDNDIVRKIAFYRAFDWSSKRFIPSTDPEKEYSD